MDTNYPSNSHVSKAKKQVQEVPEKKVEKVISGTAKTKKKSEIHKFADIFKAEDVGNVKDYIIYEYIIPNVRLAISDILISTVQIFFGGGGSVGRSKRSGLTDRVSYKSYDKMYDRREKDRRPSYGGRSDYYGTDDIILDSRAEAEEVIDSMNDVIEQYKHVTVADLCEFVGIRSNYTDTKYGWTDLTKANVVRVRDGYLLKLPKAYQVD